MSHRATSLLYYQLGTIQYSDALSYWASPHLTWLEPINITCQRSPTYCKCLLMKFDQLDRARRGWNDPPGRSLEAIGRHCDALSFDLLLKQAKNCHSAPPSLITAKSKSFRQARRQWYADDGRVPIPLRQAISWSLIIASSAVTLARSKS